MMHCARTSRSARLLTAALFISSVLQHQTVAVEDYHSTACSSSRGNDNCSCINPWRHNTALHINGYGECCTDKTVNTPSGEIHPQWCYVDSNTCELPFDMIANESAVAHSVYESTETCDNSDAYRFEQLRRNVTGGKQFRLVYPIDRTETYHNLEDQLETSNRIFIEPKEKTGNINGSVVQFMTEIFDENDINYTEVPLSELAMSKYEHNTFTACAYMVYLGLADICIGKLLDYMYFTCFDLELFY